MQVFDALLSDLFYDWLNIMTKSWYLPIMYGVRRPVVLRGLRNTKQLSTEDSKSVPAGTKFNNSQVGELPTLSTEFWVSLLSFQYNFYLFLSTTCWLVKMKIISFIEPIRESVEKMCMCYSDLNFLVHISCILFVTLYLYFYDVSSPKKSWFQISVKSVKLFG